MIVIDRISRVLIRDDKAVRLSLLECSIMAQLISSPSGIYRKGLSRHINGTYGCLSSTLSELRKKLKRLRLDITHGRNTGGMTLAINRLESKNARMDHRGYVPLDDMRRLAEEHVAVPQETGV